MRVSREMECSFSPYITSIDDNARSHTWPLKYAVPYLVTRVVFVFDRMSFSDKFKPSPSAKVPFFPSKARDWSSQSVQVDAVTTDASMTTYPTRVHPRRVRHSRHIKSSE